MELRQLVEQGHSSGERAVKAPYTLLMGEIEEAQRDAVADLLGEVAVKQVALHLHPLKLTQTADGAAR